MARVTKMMANFGQLGDFRHKKLWNFFNEKVVISVFKTFGLKVIEFGFNFENI
jgi:hypothetical protein